MDLPLTASEHSSKAALMLIAVSCVRDRSKSPPEGLQAPDGDELLRSLSGRGCCMMDAPLDLDLGIASTLAFTVCPDLSNYRMNSHVAVAPTEASSCKYLALIYFKQSLKPSMPAAAG